MNKLTASFGLALALAISSFAADATVPAAKPASTPAAVNSTANSGKAVKHTGKHKKGTAAVKSANSSAPAAKTAPAK